MAHYNGEPHASHVKSERHQEALRAAQRPPSAVAAHPLIKGALGEHGQGHAS